MADDTMEMEDRPLLLLRLRELELARFTRSP